MTRLLTLFAVLMAVDLSQAGLWDNLKLDCGVSIWSTWGKSGTGNIVRTRKVYRQPTNGGAICPHLIETDIDPWTIKDNKVKALRIKQNLLSRKPKSYSDPTIKPRDILFIIDMSGSVNAKEYSDAKQSLSKLIGKICYGFGLANANNRAAVVTYSNIVKENFDFDFHTSTAAVQKAVLALPRISGTTCTGSALKYGEGMFTASKGARLSALVENEVILLTDGMANCGPDQVIAAHNLRLKLPVKSLFVFAIGTSFNQQRINSMVTSPPSDHLFNFLSFPEFANVVKDAVAYPGDCVPLQISGK